VRPEKSTYRPPLSPRLAWGSSAPVRVSQPDHNAPATIPLLEVRKRKVCRFSVAGVRSQEGQLRWRGRADLQCCDVRCSKAFGPAALTASSPRIPTDFALFTRLMPAASSGAGSPLSAASAASFQIADILNDGGRPEPAGLQRYPPRANGGLGEARPGSMLEPRQELVQGHVVHVFRNGEDTLSSTRVFNCSSLRAFQPQLNQSFGFLSLGIIVS
jgi:hypothetical protein